ncbi:hybrid sensor histidine kinase/response regulator [Oleisolibacter albus]|uniref:hybrid sensor histidine kinase/response regulator n=1 Tax=Oleisolibacter albus TaxID=2171757 RepID=UPI000DF46EA6|nr:response regulator [Oleisolibacter albus]
MNDLQERLQQAFRQESRDYLEGIRTLLESAEAGTAPGAAALEEVSRLAHSLKGAARAVDLLPVEALAHRMETLFDRIRHGRDRLDGACLRLMRDLLDQMEDWVASLGGHPPPDDTALLARLDARLAALPAGAPAAVPLPPEITEAEPDAAAESPLPRGAGDSTIRIDAGQLDRVLLSGTELVAAQYRQGQVLRMLQEVGGTLADLQGSWLRLRKTLATAVPGGLEQGGLITLVEGFELQLRDAVRTLRTARQVKELAVRTTRQLGEDLQEDLRDARLVPVDTVFGSVRAMVRDLAAELGVAADLRVQGQEVRADRLVLQRLRDPVLHLLRNAVGHGLEPPAERRAAGKPEQGQVLLGFTVAEGQLTVTVADDGRGIDTARVRDAARRLSLLPPGPEPADDSAILALIFTPGFTTRHEVTTLSGRGLGLSIVRQAATRLGGHVTVSNRPQGGTEFRLVVPVAAMAQTLLLVQAGGQTYGIPAESIDRLLRVRRSDIGSVEGRPVVRTTEGMLPLAGLAARIGLGAQAVSPAQSALPVLVLQGQGQRLALACDAFLGLRQSLVKDLGGPLPPGGTVAGGMLLDDGGVALVLNPYGLLGVSHRGDAVTLADRPVERRTPVILVVDDSLTTRTLQKSILEAHGYEIRMAVDGVQALKRLRAEAVDLVITDVQMPQLDGFGLLSAIREDPALVRLPVILVTSLERREDRARGLALGADAYIVKRQFNQDELLSTIRQLL